MKVPIDVSKEKRLEGAVRLEMSHNKLSRVEWRG